MKQILVHRGEVIIENVPAPLVEAGYILVEVTYSLLSAGTESNNVRVSGKSLVKRAAEQPDQIKKILTYFKTHGIEKTVSKVKEKVDAGTPLGYSCSGVVIQTGYGVEDIEPGDRVACAGAGYANHAEVVIVPKNLVTKIPAECDLRSAASVTLGAIALQGIRRTQPQLGEYIAVIGLGLLGQLTIQLLKANGCHVVGIDIDERRAQIAKSLGADMVLFSQADENLNKISHLTQGYGVDATIITAASKSNKIIQQAMEITRKKGRVVIVGDVGLELQRKPFYEKELDLLISCSYGPGRYDPNYEMLGIDYPYAYVRWTEKRNMQAYLKLIAAEKIDLTAILEKEYEISEASQAYSDLQRTENRPLGVLLRYSSKPISNVPLVYYQQKKKISSGKIGMAVVGAGDFAKSIHLPNLKKLSNMFHLRAVMSLRGHNAAATAKQFNADYATTSYEEILEDPEVDAVLISTRHHLHAQQIIQALNAGKHVYCEKPLALTKCELNDVVAFYGFSIQDFEKGQIEIHNDLFPILTIGYNRRFSPAGSALKHFTANRQLPLMVSYRVNAGLLKPDHWVYSEQGGGRILGEMCHMFDFFSYIVGYSPREVSLQAMKSPADHIDPRDNVSIAVKYDDGSICTLVYTSLGSRSQEKEYIEVFADGMTAILNDFKSYKELGGENKKWSSLIADKGHLAALQKFGEAIINQSAWPIPLQELVETSLLSLSANRLTLE